MSGNQGLAGYTWPDEALTCTVTGTGGPRIAVGLLPHPNEPLGSAFAATAGSHAGELGTLALVGPIDPPPPSHRFPMPCDPVAFVAQGYLPTLPEQVEFAHCADPQTPAQCRAARFRAAIEELAPDVLVLLHNDPTAQAPYLYANSPWPKLEQRLRDDFSTDFPEWKPLGASWTHRLSERTYAYFPGDRIGVRGTEAAGIYIERELGIPTLTLELTMFSWGAADPLRLGFRQALGQWVADGGVHGGDRDDLTRHVTRLLQGQHVSMIPPAVSSRVVWSVLQGLRDTLAR